MSEWLDTYRGRETAERRCFADWWKYANLKGNIRCSANLYMKTNVTAEVTLFIDPLWLTWRGCPEILEPSLTCPVPAELARRDFFFGSDFPLFDLRRFVAPVDVSGMVFDVKVSASCQSF